MTNREQRPGSREGRGSPSLRKRRRTPAARRAYTRAAILAVVAVGLVAGAVYGISSLITNETANAGTSSVAKPGTSSVASVAGGASTPDDAIETMASSTVKVLEGQKLKGIIDLNVQNLQSANTAPENTTTTNPDGTTTTDTGIKTPVTPTPPAPVKFDPATVGATGQANIVGWKEKNKDVVGWLKVPNTNINYPVVVGPDNLYYNTKGYDKQYNVNGVIWADSDTKFGGRSQISQNNVLYGHNWTNYSANPAIGRASDVMFGQLTSFHHLNFAKSTPYIHYSTGAEAMTWKVFAVFYTEESFNYITSDPGSQGLQYIIDEARSRSRHKYDVEVSSSDKILTLSTCTRAYGQTSKQRFVVMARLMRPGETITEVNITDNPNHKKPKI